MIGWRLKSEVEKALGYRFRDPALLALALTHRSYANEQGLDGHNERLEFLGDAVLGLIAGEWLYREHPDLPEGDLSKLKAYLVSAPALARLSTELAIAQALRVGVGEERSGGRGKRSLLADTTEAVIGALYLDGGLAAARRALEPLLEGELADHAGVFDADTKTRLQEEVQARGWELPEYRLVAEVGPDHDKRFTVECWIQDLAAGTGVGRSKKRAEQRAAAEALQAFLAGESVAAGGGEPVPR